jgi:multidrug efflux pump subunit AcrA (membrane-fusion protein)
MRRFKPWQWGGLAAVAVIIVAAIIGRSVLFGGGEEPTVPARNEAIVDQELPARRDIRVNGSLFFPHREELTFDATGEVGEVLVREGQPVAAGQELAHLDDLTVTALAQRVADAQFALDAAQDALEAAREDFVHTPLEQAEFEAKIANAQKEVDDARESLEDYRRDHQQTLAARMTARVQAEVAVDDARKQLSYYDRDQGGDLAAAINKISAGELALETAREQLANFETDFENAVAFGGLVRASAETALDAAEADLNGFLRNPTRDFENDRPIDLELLQRLRDAFDAATTNLKQAEVALADLENDRELELQERQAAVAQTESDLAVARDDLRQVKDATGQELILQERLAVLEGAEAVLSQAVIDLEEETVGPDQAELAVRQKVLSVAQEKLAELTDGPELLDVAVKEAAAAAAQAAVDDAREELAGATVRAPFAGIIFLVNVATEDRVNDESRVIELIDPTELEVDGLLNAIDLPCVAEGDASKINIASVPGREFEGTVLRVAEEPRTERGVVSYPVRIKVDLPAGVAVPANLSAVTSTITYRGDCGG